MRLELFANTIDTLRFFDLQTQRSLPSTDTAQVHAPNEFVLIPCREIDFNGETQQRASIKFKASLANRNYDEEEAQQISRSLAKGQYFHGVEFLLDYFYESRQTPLDFFSDHIHAWYVDPIAIARQFDKSFSDLKSEYENSLESALLPDFKGLYLTYDDMQLPPDSQKVVFEKVHIHEGTEPEAPEAEWSVNTLTELDTPSSGDEKQKQMLTKINQWKQSGQRVVLASATKASTERLLLFCEKAGLQVQLVDSTNYDFSAWLQQQTEQENLVHIVPRRLENSLKFL